MTVHSQCQSAHCHRDICPSVCWTSGGDGATKWSTVCSDTWWAWSAFYFSHADPSPPQDQSPQVLSNVPCIAAQSASFCCFSAENTTFFQFVIQILQTLPLLPALKHSAAALMDTHFVSNRNPPQSGAAGSRFKSRIRVSGFDYRDSLHIICIITHVNIHIHNLCVCAVVSWWCMWYLDG